jgi:peptide/nickel transport system ATP-binding protein
MSTTPLLRVRDLRVVLPTAEGPVAAVDGLDLQLDAGGALGIVGESGSGKSLTALALMGLTRFVPGAQVSGRVELDGVDLLALPDRRLRRHRGTDVAMVFQDPLTALHPHLRVGSQLVEAIRAHRRVPRRVAASRAAELLELVGVPEPRRRLRAYPHELSGGLRQRVVIAMALAHEPRVVIADEPTTALDVTVQAQVLHLLKRLQRELGTALVIITHDLGVVAQTADEIAVMYAGRIVEQGPARTVLRTPEHPYTWGLLGSIPSADAPSGAELTPVPGRAPGLHERPAGCAFHPRCAHARPEHARREPGLASTGADPSHRVACLLPADERRRLWAAARAAEAPA